ncbi:MAG: hypothetical protein DLM69_04095, partial [Candidatus Chloroheliales bacterium]
PPPGPPSGDGGAVTSGSTTGAAPNPATAPAGSVAPKTGEQSPLPIYLLIGGLIALVAGVVVIRLSNRRVKK